MYMYLACILIINPRPSLTKDQLLNHLYDNCLCVSSQILPHLENTENRSFAFFYDSRSKKNLNFIWVVNLWVTFKYEKMDFIHYHFEIHAS